MEPSFGMSEMENRGKRVERPFAKAPLDLLTCSEKEFHNWLEVASGRKDKKGKKHISKN